MEAQDAYKDIDGTESHVLTVPELLEVQIFAW